MKLYIYDCCPYSVRARMLVGLKNIECELDYIFAHDVDTPTKMIGKKTVPILEKDNGTYLGESWEINRYLDQLDDKAVLGEIPNSSVLEDWYEANQLELNKLIYPLLAKSNLPEFSSKIAVDYFVSSKEDSFDVSFDEAISQAIELKRLIESKLDELTSHLNQDAINGGPLTADDFTLFPMLRNLTLVKDFQFPPQLKTYLQAISERTKVPLYYDIAI